MNPGDRSVFDLSHDRKLSLQMGQLVPVFVQEVIPGDYWKVATSLMIRFGALLAPMMHKVDAFVHYYFVPRRQVWANFENFISGGEDGADATAMPYIEIAGPVAEGSLEDHLGIPIRYNGAVPPVSIAFDSNLQVDACYFRVYNAIYNHWYRNRLLQTKVAISTGDGADVTTAHTLLYRNWEKDYFTGAKDNPQLGAAVTLPLGTEAEVLRRTDAAATWKGYQAGAAGTGDAGALSLSGAHKVVDFNGHALNFDPKDGAALSSLYADLTNATAATINSIRQAFQIQKWQEWMMDGVQGLYVELVRKFFGVTLEDYRAQRPVYLGGLRTPVVVSEVLQTSETTVNSPQGAMAGHAFSAENSRGFARGFQEHGIIMGLLSIMPRTAYQHGLPRMFQRTTKFHYVWPQFVNLGMQEIYSKELYCTGEAGDATVFGYTGRYDEYRHCESSVHGQFKNGLDFWHLARKFTARPTLVSAFVTADPDDRVFAVTGEDTIYAHVYHNVKAVRPLPVVAVPGFIDH